MSMHCALCGRLTLHPAVLIGTYPVGPKCARRAGLVPLASRKTGLVAQVNARRVTPKRDTRTRDLFQEAE